MSNKKYIKKSLALSQLNCKINDFTSEILDIVNADSKGELYKSFVRSFLKYIPVDYRSKNKIDLFGDFTNEVFEFFLHKKPNNRKIEISKTEFQNNPAITISIVTENRPFIIDSLHNLMSKLALQTIFTFHPVIPTIRDRDGKLQEITSKGNGIVNESLVYIKAIGSFDDTTLSTIKDEINKIIDLVDYTYNSWQDLLNKLIVVTTDIAHRKDIYKKVYSSTEETLDFLNWIQKNNITFLGVINFDVESKKFTHQEGVKDIWQNNLNEISTIIESSKSKYYEDKLAMLGKINKLSPVHRNALVDYILIKHLDDDGVYRSGTIILGLYGTAIYFQSIKNIPILRSKMNYVLEESGFPLTGYNTKKIKNIIESLPRDMLIQIDEQDLYCMCIHMLSSMLSRKLKLFVQQDWSNSFINVIIFLPRERLTPEVYNEISCYLSDKFGSKIIADNITVVAQNFSHLFATIAIEDMSKLDFSHDKIEKELIQITTNWSEGLLQELCEELGEYKAGIRHKEVESSFPIEYRHKFNATTTIEDIRHLEESSKSGKLVFNLIKGSKNNEFILKFYSSETPLTLSDILPSIENLGFIAIDEQSFVIKESSILKKSWIYEFILSTPIAITLPFKDLKYNIEEALSRMNEGFLTTDMLCKLLVLSGLNWTQVKLLKALTRYLHQTGFLYGKAYVQKTLISHHKFAEMLVDLFEARFHPEKRSPKKVASLSNKMSEYLDEVSITTEDKVLQSMKSIVDSMLRTNFYQKPNTKEETGLKSYLSFKFRSNLIPDLPLPLPFAEIFVYSSDFEGIHLRGGKVARGGIRWSDRGEDYRTEVLGLMKAQMAKNTVIVPLGSKGTFYVNFSQGTMSREDYLKKGILCYQNFLRGMLDITDNLVDSKIIHPKDTVTYDDPNPYLVVAADKGTATFSDYANEISREYNFWLGDAFASGGSAGYDHKKMAITAKGAWISAQLHFRTMGVDIQKEPFTVVGVGDMSGDVFGNGMLLSKYIKLVAAFNHQHIFIDPKPDHKTSYKERRRLFTMPRTKWSDYNPDIISQGGGVFDRSAKTLNISKEIQELLDLKSETITPDNLIKAILKSNVDLLWNGGIGTYVKSSIENNIDIGDKANDQLRINGSELNAKVVAEGGNVGLSQLGRVEYALNGGHINTDFIDNSAGVDCSDHEVNIKIALNNAVRSGKITMNDRNKILTQMTEHVENLVLQDNYDQNFAITLSSLSKSVNIESFTQLTKDLESESLLDKEVEFLPNKAELSRRVIAKEGMTRPELAILLSYSKMSFENKLASSEFANDDYFKKYLFNYFPKIMQKQFKKEIENHPLREEIIRTVISNKLVNQLGGSLISLIEKETSGDPCNIARAYAAVVEIFDLDRVWTQIVNLEASVNIEAKVDMCSNICRVIRRGIIWFVRNAQHPMNVTETIKEFSSQTQKLTKFISDFLREHNKTRFACRMNHYIESGVSEELTNYIINLEASVSAFDIIHIARRTNIKNDTIAKLYFETGEIFSIDWLRQSCSAQVNESYWNRLSIQSLKDDFYDKQRRLVSAIVTSNVGQKKIDLELWLKENIEIASIFTNFAKDIKMQETVNLNMIIIANKKLEIFLRKLNEE